MFIVPILGFFIFTYINTIPFADDISEDFSIKRTRSSTKPKPKPKPKAKPKAVKKEKPQPQAKKKPEPKAVKEKKGRCLFWFAAFWGRLWTFEFEYEQKNN